MTTVVIAGGGTGGHLMPALALADGFRRRRPDVEVVLVGAERGIEATILPTRDLPYRLLPAEPLYRHAWWRNLRWPMLLPRLWQACTEALDATRPALVVGTGGYAAGPILFAGSRRGVPIALQEQNAFPGVTTRLAARWARQVHLGFPEARDRLRVRAGAAVFTLGNPIVPPRTTDRAAARSALGLDAGRATVLVTGGSQGSRAINTAVARALDAGHFADAALLWSVGERAYPDLVRYDRPPHVQVRAFWDPIAPAYAAADLVVARAGAMTVAELAAWGLPAVLVPLPTAAADHQSANARAVETAGAGVHLPEAMLTANRLAEAVGSVLGDAGRRADMAAAARARGRPGAADAIVDRLLELVPGRASLS